MARFDVLGPTHKGLRNGLTKIQFTTAQLDFSDAKQLASLLESLEWMMKILDAHALGEDKFLFPLLQKVNPVVFKILEEEHGGLERVQTSLIEELQNIKGQSSSNREELGILFTRNLNDFVAHYFIHLQTEELKAIPELWNSYEDSELMQAVGKFASITPSDVLAKFVEYIIPALNPKERISFMMTIKNSASEQVFNNFLAISKNVLTMESFTNLEKGI